MIELVLCMYLAYKVVHSKMQNFYPCINHAINHKNTILLRIRKATEFDVSLLSLESISEFRVSDFYYFFQVICILISTFTIASDFSHLCSLLCTDAYLFHSKNPWMAMMV